MPPTLLPVLTTPRPGGHDPQLLEVAGELLQRSGEVGTAITRRIRERVPFYQAVDTVPPDDLHRSITANLDFVLRSFVDGVAPDVFPAQDLGRRRAAQGVPLLAILAAYRVGFRELWQLMVEGADRRRDTQNRALVEASSDLWAAHESFTDAVSIAYQETVMAATLRRETERAALTAALLEGRPLDTEAGWGITDVLGIPGRGPFAVVAAEVRHVAQEPLPNVEAVLRHAGMSSAWHLLPDLQAGIVHLPDGQGLGRLVEIVTPLTPTRVGISPIYLAWRETAASLQLARVALGTNPPGPQVAVFGAVPLATAAASAPETARRLSREVFGTLLDLPADEQRLLLDTLTAWRDNGGSATEAAQQLFCHPNTVRYRLRRLETHTGRSLADPEATAELLFALHALRLSPEGDPPRPPA